MEQQLFDWESVDYYDFNLYVFYDITLKQVIKDYPIGTKFASARLSFDDGILHLRDKHSVTLVEVELKLSVK